MRTSKEIGEVTTNDSKFLCSNCMNTWSRSTPDEKRIRRISLWEDLPDVVTKCQICGSSDIDFEVSLKQKVFLIKDNNANSWSGTTYIYPNVFRSRETARKYIGVVSDYFSDLSKPIEPYFSILEVELS